MQLDHSKPFPKRAGFLFAWMAITIVYFAIRINLLDIPLDRDEGTFGLIGRAILEGGVPYIDAIDHKPPLLFFIYAAALLIFPPTAFGIHLFLHLYNFLTLITLFFVSRRLFGLAGALWASLAFALFSANQTIQGFTGSSEMFMLLPLSLSLLFALRGSQHGLQLAPLLISGIFGALACWTKPTVVSSVLFVVILIAAMLIRNSEAPERRAHIVKGWSAWLAGGIGISLLIAGYFAANGALGELIYWVFEHGAIYSAEADFATSLEIVSENLWLILLSSPVITGAAMLVALFFSRQNAFVACAVWGFFLFSLAGTLMGFTYAHYFAQLAPAVALICGFGVGELTSRLHESHALRVTAPVMALMMVAGEVGPNFAYYVSSSPKEISQDHFGPNPFYESEELAAYLHSHSKADDKVLIFGSEPQILLLAERASATSYVVIYPLLWEAFPRYREFQEKMMREISDEPPAFIIITNLPFSLRWDEEASLEPLYMVNRMIREGYSLQYEMQLSMHQRQWITMTDETPPPVDSGERYFIRIYRQRS
jgi:hypothetical protein